MGRRPNMERIQRMYAVYQSGKSLSEVAEVFGITRQSVYTAFKDRGLTLRPKRTPLPYVEFNGNKYTMRTNLQISL